MTTVVLGWDALDVQLIEEFDLQEAFGEKYSTIETFDNKVAGEPLTREVWPSIITGVPPTEHQIYAETEKSGIEWNSPFINTVSTLAQGIVPHFIRLKIGRVLRNRGEEVKQYDADYYEDVGVSTVFSEYRCRPISIPNYSVERDAKVDVGIDRTSIWTGVLESVDTGEKTAYRPLVPLDELEEHLIAKAHKRLGLVRSALAQNYDLVFCWFGYLDTVGHLDVMIDTDDWQARHYNLAARMTRNIRDELGEDDTLVCVSDHGLRNGYHTHDATIAGPDEVVSTVDSVFDVRSAIESVTTANGESGIEDWNGDKTDDVKENLEALGYLS